MEVKPGEAGEMVRSYDNIAVSSILVCYSITRIIALNLFHEEELTIPKLPTQIIIWRTEWQRGISSLTGAPNCRPASPAVPALSHEKEGGKEGGGQSRGRKASWGPAESWLDGRASASNQGPKEEIDFFANECDQATQV